MSSKRAKRRTSPNRDDSTTGRQATRAARSTATASARGAPPRADPVALGGGALLFAACVIPIVLWGNPYPDDLLRYWVVGGAAAVVVTVIALSLQGDPAHVLADWLRRPSPAAFAAAVGLAAFALSLACAVFAFHRGASTSDELAELWHARILLSGHLSLPVDPNREFFSLDNVVDTGRWYSQFPIGGPAFVAIGALVGAPWLVNPMLLGVSAALLYQFGRRAFGETRGRASAALFCVAPMVLMIAGTWMNHVPVLFLALCALVALVAWADAPSPRRGVMFAGVIGLAIGGMATIRPLDAVVMVLVVGAFQLSVLRAAPGRTRELAVQIFCGVVGVAPLLYANWSTTGSPLTFGYDMSWGTGHRVGFHTDPYGNPHTLRQALEYAVTYVSELNINLMAWPVPALAFAIVALVVARCTNRWDVLVLGFFWTQVAAYAAYWGEGQFLGPRFLYTALPAAIVLIAWLPFAVGDRFGDKPRRGAIVLVAVCVAIAWGIPAGSYGVWGLATQARGTRAILKTDILGAVRSANVHNALIFLREPFGARLARRMWGAGVMRSDAAQLLATRDACSLLAAVETAEHDARASASEKAAGVARSAAPFVPGTSVVRAADATIRISSPASITPNCRAELEADLRPTGTAFGPALPLEPIGPGGHLDGDVIYAADLGERNDVLRQRFGRRTWYRLTVVAGDRGEPQARLQPY